VDECEVGSTTITRRALSRLIFSRSRTRTLTPTAARIACGCATRHHARLLEILVNLVVHLEALLNLELPRVDLLVLDL
jgi:hypothetical protein